MAYIVKLKDMFAFWLDSFNMITKQRDGGDTCANMFTALYCRVGLPSEAFHALTSLTRNGIPIRHPDPAKWYSHVDRTSRDQLTPYLCFVAKESLYTPWFYRLAKQHAKRLFLFTWNTRRNFQYPTLAEHLQKSTPDVTWNYSWKPPDICGPDIWAIYARGLIWRRPIALLSLWPILAIADIQNFLAIAPLLLKRRMGWKFGRTSEPKRLNHDCRNLTLKVHFAAQHIPSPLATLNWYLWKPLANEAAVSFWMQPHEPPMHKAIELLR